MLYLVLQHPIIAGIIVIAFVIFAIWFLRKMFGLVKRFFSFGAHKDKDPAAPVVNAASPK